MASNRPLRLPSTKYPPPGPQNEGAPVPDLKDWSYAASQMMELARRRVNGSDDLNLGHLDPLQQRAQAFIAAVSAANMFPDLLAALRVWQSSNPTDNYGLFKTVVTKFAEGKRRDLVDQFLEFRPAGWE